MIGADINVGASNASCSPPRSAGTNPTLRSAGIEIISRTFADVGERDVVGSRTHHHIHGVLEERDPVITFGCWGVITTVTWTKVDAVQVLEIADYH